MHIANIKFPKFEGTQCLMMPYIQGDINSVPKRYHRYKDILENVFIDAGSIGFLTIDESYVEPRNAQRAYRSKYGRALHTEVGIGHDGSYCWGGGYWGGRANVLVEKGTRVLLANSINGSCAIWDTEHADTSMDGDIGYCANEYPYSDAIMMGAGEVHEIGIFTPHESLPIKKGANRQFLRIVGSGVHGSEPYFTKNELI